MNKIKLLVLGIIALTVMPAVAQMSQIPQLPIDPAVRHGKLPNGLTYYIRHNAEPKGQADFYIAQKVGSVQEEEEQRGLAHFLEHMAFNGSNHFPADGQLVKYCESIGVKFGQNLNAYTSTDETVYNIDNVPMTGNNLDSCLYILQDWAGGLHLTDKEIDKERGVINEEWRMSTTGAMRIYERQLPNLYPGSRYGNRLPIGLMSVVNHFPYDVLRAYYKKWYRPDLQGIVIVGDIDADEVEQRVKTLFSPLTMPENPAAYEHYPVPDNSEPIYIIDKDKELRSPSIGLSFKHKPMPAELRNTMVFLAQGYMHGIINRSINARLNELSQKPDCPFVGAGVSYGNYLLSKTCDAFELNIVPKNGQDAAAVKAALQEVERAARHGITATEIIRARDEFLSGMERIYDNREKQKNSFYTKQYVRHFLENNAVPGIETEYDLCKMLAQQIPYDVLNKEIARLAASIDTNFVFFAMYPDKAEQTIPTVEAMKAAVSEAKGADLEAYVDNVKNEPLIAKLPKKGKISKESPAAFGYTKWTLSNGANVYFKKTDFNDAQVIMSAHSFGGNSKFADRDLENFLLLDDAISSTGLGNFKATELEKKLAGKQASVSFGVGELSESVSGISTPKDLRTLFELIYLRFQKPVDDPDAYNNFMAMMKTQLENAGKLPMSAFRDSISSTLYKGVARKQPVSLATLAKADYNTMKRLYTERFNAAGDFDFYFTGAFDTDSLRAFTEQYIAPLPKAKKREAYTDLGIEMTKGEVENRFRRKMETPQAYILQVWHGETPYSLKTAATISAFGDILEKRLLKTIREDGGMAYSVNASASAEKGKKEQYSLQIVCPFTPEKCDSVLYLIEEGIRGIAQNGVTESELEDVRKFELKEYAEAQRNNGYWQGLILNRNNWNVDSRTGYEDCIKTVSSKDIQDFVNNVLYRHRNRSTVIMLPEEQDTDGAK
ncbi:insulinase family protein [Alloprevotella sp. OH1205_COT-284]|uniref:M16 family metallopeptidase n=1 Tax=Alloprevotella sp. OH1205_COT-284 TaxID=2491043 RepID=UPI000F5F7737|nr:insulinase family protein [Alloprevotella sp. OH1205_COT-284]RRD79802.1 insulinase family protein [Alloprevotella sp. OH1205_COT-284]